MTSTDMDPDVSRAVRSELAAIGTKRSRLQRHQRRARLVGVGIGVVVAAGLTTGAAIVVNHFPGSTTVTPLGGLHSATGTGSGELDLGPAPTAATRAVLTVQCLNSVGSISIASVPQAKGQVGDFATFYCAGGGRIDSHGAVDPWHMKDALLPPQGSTSIAITADPGTRWAISGQYASASVTPWGENAKGETYGACNVDGCPDLIGAQATNGKIGFVVIKQMTAVRGSGTVPVYQSDGTTIIGRFAIGDASGQTDVDPSDASTDPPH
ncbi:MAG TPA: hypothetical protein VGM70_08930 [Pseudolysinimonas sp.]|jgi:hypothetical protein